MSETNISIAQKIKLERIEKIAEKIGLTPENLFLYGPYMAKIDLKSVKNLDKQNGKLILVTAITPTKSGEGKSTVTVGLGQALNKLNQKVMMCLREPSLGPCFGIKGGASGGGYSQVLPMEEINLHFTGDIAAVAAANNLLAAVIDNHIVQGNELNINPDSVVWRRAIDMNDRTLRSIYVGCDERKICLRKDIFEITAASEVMAILCLSEDFIDLKKRLDKIIVAYTFNGKPVYAYNLKVAGAMAALLKHAIKPNLVQSVEKVPVLIHGGPFANIAHGCNSIIATKLALKLADLVVTEAGFGADLGAEKFLDIKCRVAGIRPNAVVLVATIKALKSHDSLEGGFLNLEKHIENLKKYKLPIVVALNKFVGDELADIELVKKKCDEFGIDFVVADPWNGGGSGCIELAEKVLSVIDGKNFQFLYDVNLPIKEKISIIAKEIYGALGVNYSVEAQRQLDLIENLNLNKLPVCIAKTQMSLSDDPKLKGRPVGFNITIRDLKISAGAGFIVALAGNIMTMPGLPKHPNAELIDIDSEGVISGLF
ncbi:MAG: formate--tetrahydrofolate ligase [Nanoarchaeota archaeon]